MLAANMAVSHFHPHRYYESAPTAAVHSKKAKGNVETLSKYVYVKIVMERRLDGAAVIEVSE